MPNIADPVVAVDQFGREIHASEYYGDPTSFSIILPNGRPQHHNPNSAQGRRDQMRSGKGRKNLIRLNKKVTPGFQRKVARAALAKAKFGKKAGAGLPLLQRKVAMKSKIKAQFVKKSPGQMSRPGGLIVS